MTSSSPQNCAVWMLSLYVFTGTGAASSPSPPVGGGPAADIVLCNKLYIVLEFNIQFSGDNEINFTAKCQCSRDYVVLGYGFLLLKSRTWGSGVWNM